MTKDTSTGSRGLSTAPTDPALLALLPPASSETSSAEDQLLEELRSAKMLYDMTHDEYYATRVNFEEFKSDTDRQMYAMCEQCNHLDHGNVESEVAVLLARRITEMSEELNYVVHGAHESREGSRQFHARADRLMAKNSEIERIADQMIIKSKPCNLRL